MAETVLMVSGAPVEIIKEPDDPICDRVSLGGSPKIGYYIVYRGEEEDIQRTLETVLAAFKMYNREDKNASDNRNAGDDRPAKTS